MPLTTVALFALFAAAASQGLAGQAAERQQPTGSAQADDELSLLQSHLAVEGNRGDALEGLNHLKAVAIENITRELEAQLPDLFSGQSPVAILGEMATVLRNSVVIDGLTSAFQSAPSIVTGFVNGLTGNLATLRGTVSSSASSPSASMLAENTAALKSFLNVEIMNFSQSLGTLFFSLKPALDQVPAGGFIDRLLPGMRERLSGTQESWEERFAANLTNATNDFLDGGGDMCERFQSWAVMETLSYYYQYTGVTLPSMVTQIQSVANTVMPFAGFLFSDITAPLQSIVDRAVQFSQDALTPLSTGISDIQNTITEVVNVTFGCNSSNRTVLEPAASPAEPAAAPSPAAASPSTASSSGSGQETTAATATTAAAATTTTAAAAATTTTAAAAASAAAATTTTAAAAAPATTTTAAAAAATTTTTAAATTTTAAASSSSDSTQAEVGTHSQPTVAAPPSVGPLNNILGGNGQRAGLGVGLGLSLVLGMLVF